MRSLEIRSLALPGREVACESQRTIKNYKLKIENCKVQIARFVVSLCSRPFTRIEFAIFSFQFSFFTAWSTAFDD
jgi:hypothetical protein